MLIPSIARLGLVALLCLAGCSRNKVPAETAKADAWIAFNNQKSGSIQFPIEQISAEWVGRNFSVAIATSDGRMLQIQQLETDTLPGIYDGGTFKLVYMPGNFQQPCISQHPKKNNLDIVKTATGYTILLKGTFDCPDFKYTVTGAIPITEPSSPQRTIYPIAR